MEGLVAMVCGTSPNIGTGIALGLAAEGATVACVDANPRHAELCAGEIEANGGAATPLPCDTTDEAQVSAAVEAAETKLGPIDVLVNGIATFNHKGVLDMSSTEWRSQIDIILTSAFLCTKHVAASMCSRGNGGAIVTLISTAGHQGQAGNVAYSTAKGGLLNFTRSVAMELAPHGIRVNSMTPTATDPSDGRERAQRWGLAGPEEMAGFDIDDIAPMLPLGRLPSPSDYGRAIAFLCSRDAALITGTDLCVDAGVLAQYWHSIGARS